MKLLIPDRCHCLYAKDTDVLLAKCARCRAASDPEFARRCAQMPKPCAPRKPVRKTKRHRSRK